MKVLVTGHLGYIGSVLVPLLLEAGYEVAGIDSGLFETCLLGPPPPTVPTLYKDIRDVEREDVVGSEAIIHLAGLSNDPLGDLEPEVTDEINHRASVRLAELARECGVKRFLFASSCSMYGAAGQEFRNEESPFNPVTPYAWSKIRAEEGLRKLISDDFCIAFLRCATAYGASPRIRFDLVVNNLTAWAYASRTVFLKSHGSSWRPLIHVEDLARTYLLFLTAPTRVISGQAFNVGSCAQNYLISQLADQVRQHVPGANIVRAADAMPDPRSYRVNFDKLASSFPGSTFAWDISRGIRQLLDVYDRNRLQSEIFEGPDFQRVSYLRNSLEKGQIDRTLRRRQ